MGIFRPSLHTLRTAFHSASILPSHTPGRFLLDTQKFSFLYFFTYRETPSIYSRIEPGNDAFDSNGFRF